MGATSLWAKCMAECEGNEHKAKYNYIYDRVRSLERIKNKSASQKEAQLREGKGFFENLSNGNYGLARTYWVYGVLLGLALCIPLYFIRTVVLIPYFLFWTFYQMVVLTGIWKSSNKYKGSKIWVIMARFAAILGWLSLITLWFTQVYMPLYNA
jgi:hypothetical protein